MANYTTPASLLLDEGTYEISVVASIVIGLDTYKFESWENGSHDLTRTLLLDQDKTITATYEKATILQIRANYESEEVFAQVEIVGVGTYTSPFQKELLADTYVLNATFKGQTLTQNITVTDASTTTYTFLFTAPTPPVQEEPPSPQPQQPTQQPVTARTEGYRIRVYP